MGNIREWRERIRAQEENKLGAVYAACEKQGCSRDFVKAFITRAGIVADETNVIFRGIQAPCGRLGNSSQSFN